MDATLLSLLLFCVALLCIYLRNCYSYWSKQGVPCAKGLIPMLGHMLPVLTMKMNFGMLSKRMYQEHKNVSMVGFYNARKPALLLRDPELVKSVMQTQFSNFHENQLKINPRDDPLLAKNPFFCYGEPWQKGRKRFTYAFSSMRLKMLFETVKVVCGKFEKHLEERVRPGKKYEVELKELFSRFTAEVVANASLGVEGFCFDDDKYNESFLWIGKSFLQPNLKNALVQVLNFYMPVLNKIFRYSFLPKHIDAFFRNIVRGVITSRAKEQGRRNDFFQLMMDLEKVEGEKIDEETLVAHVLSFFLDGYETSSITLSFLAFMLASYPEAQEKLREEVRSVLAKDGGDVSYDNLKEMTYMDKALSESQRLYPAVGFLGKVCTKQCELEGSDGIRCRLDPGTEIIVPVYGLQSDPKYWKEPEVFDPTRFNDSKKDEIEKFAFLPFGEGPRICIGMRMAILQMKAAIATLMKSYKLEVSTRMKLPLKLSANYFLTAPEDGLWVNISRA